jgi:ubiquinone/menaquinone biosynthesis C-methylase UbiE
VSDIVNGLISIKPLFGVMKVQARKTLIGTAEQNGIPWSQRAAALGKQGPTLQAYYDEVERKEVVSAGYPSYYTQEFHAYDEGNLNWIAAYECESATMSMALRVYPKDGLTAEVAQDRLRYSFMDTVESYMNEPRPTANTPLSGLAALQSLFSGGKSAAMAGPTKIIDIGCSVGMSTFYLAEKFANAKVIDALDLSPHFLAVAKQRQAGATGADISPDAAANAATGVWKGLERFATAKLNRIRWIHGNAEATALPDNYYDITAASFMFHELPQQPSEVIIAEMCRITKPDGVVAITDNNPKSAVIQGTIERFD